MKSYQKPLKYSSPLYSSAMATSTQSKDSAFNVVRVTMSRRVLLSLSIFAQISVMSLWLIAVWPGSFSPDSLDSINQVRTSKYSDWSPVTFQIYLKIITINGKYLILAPISNLILLSFTLNIIFFHLNPSLSCAKRVNLSTLLLCTPFIGQMGLQVWKDIPFSCFVLIGSTIFFNSIRRGLTLRKILWSVFFLSIGTSFRHDGIVWLCLFAFLSLCSFLIGKNRENAKILTITLISAGTLSLTLSYALVQITDAESRPKWFSSLAFFQDLAYTANEDPQGLNSSTLKNIEKVSTNQSLQGATTCEFPDAIIWNQGFDPEAFTRLSKQIKLDWIKSLKNNWQTFLERRLCTSISFLPPLPLYEKNPLYNPSAWKFEWIGWGVYEPIGREMGILNSPRNEEIHKWVTRWSSFSTNGGAVTAWPGLHLLIIAMILIFHKWRKLKDLDFQFMKILFLIALTRNISLIVIGAGAGYRFSFVTHIVSLVLIAIMAFSGFELLGSRFQYIFSLIQRKV